MAVFDGWNVTSLKKLPPDLSLEKKINIKEAGRPTPCLDIKIITKSENRDYKREFKIDIYEKHSWLCGCEVTNRLYCFPCLLFKSDDSDPIWVHSGVADLAHITQKIKKHESAHAHLNAVLEYNILGKVDIRQQLDASYREKIQIHSQQRRRNRIVLTKIIDSIKECPAFELALRGFDESKETGFSDVSSSRPVNFSVELDACLKKNLNCASDFSSAPEEILNDLLDCMLTVCQDSIRKEIAAAEFVSVIADETTEFTTSFQLAIFFRYLLSDGRPVERFWQFCNPPVIDAKSIAGCIHENLESVIDNTEKLVSQSYDGATIMGREHGVVQAIIQQLYKRANFINYYSHDLNHIIQLNCENQNVRIFFSNLTEINNFFSSSSRRKPVLENFIAKRVPQAGDKNGFFNFLTLQGSCTLKGFRQELIECLKEIEKSSKLTTEINQAGSIRRMLLDPSFVFWLAVFKVIFPPVDRLSKLLLKTNIDGAVIRKCIMHFKSLLGKEKENMVKLLSLVDEVAPPEPLKSPSLKKRKSESLAELDALNKTETAKEACDVIVNQVQKRYSFTSYFTALRLFDPVKFDDYESCFPSTMLNEFEEAYPFIEKDRLVTELSVIYRRKEFRCLSEPVVLLQFIIENNLQTAFSETCKLLRIITTYPVAATKDEGFSALRRIRSFLSNSAAHEDRLSPLAMLSVEKEMVDNISDFSNKVIELFYAKQERPEFVFETCK